MNPINGCRRFEDKVVLITGGASGIGASLVAHFCAQRARVAFIDVDEERATRLAADLLERGLPAPRFFPCDLRIVDDPAGPSARSLISSARLRFWSTTPLTTPGQRATRSRPTPGTTR